MLPLAVGLDAMRQLAFAGTAYPTGTPSPEVEALILVVMAVVFIGARPLDRSSRSSDAPAREGRLSVRWQ